MNLLSRMLLTFLKVSFLTLIFASLNSIDGVTPYSAALLIGLLYVNKNPFFLILPYILSYFVFQKFEITLCASIQVLLLSAIFYLCRKKNTLPKIELIFYFLISMLPFILITGGGYLNFSGILGRIIASSVIGLFSFVSITACQSILSYKKRKKPNLSELTTLIVIFITTSVGFINLFGSYTYRFFAVLVLLLSIKTIGKEKGAVVSGILAVPLAIALKQPEYFAVFFIWFIASALTMDISRLLASLSLLVSEGIIIYFLGIYTNYGLVEAVLTMLGAIIFGFIPTNLFERYFSFTPKEILTRHAINRTRLMLSGKLYEMSSAFYELQTSFQDIKRSSESLDFLSKKIAEETTYRVCKSCVFMEKCKNKNFPSIALLDKIIKLGTAKKRLSLIDLPREFTENCTYPNSIIFELNRLIGQFLPKLDSASESEKGKEIVSLQAEGLGKMLKSLAFDFSKTLSINSTAEKYYLKELSKHGYKPYGLMILGEDENCEFCLFCDEELIKVVDFNNSISSIAKMPLAISSVVPYGDGTVFAIYKKAPMFDAAFGVTSITKNGSKMCGDTHSLLKIDENKFLVALSDGMGSGETAAMTSSGAINLIEAFYRAGIDSSIILPTVNKVLSMSVDDNFSAIDLGVVDLSKGNADFIKIGAPFGFIISTDGIRFIEGSSLPLGILDEFKPSGSTLKISSGDVIIMLSDGVTDSFGSSSDMIEYLKNAPLRNPQTLADSIVKRALNLCGGEAIDDMTALCIRIFNRAS